MQLHPRYEAPPVVQVDAPVGDASVPLLRQRRRLADALGALTVEQWAVPSRCAGWSVQDVIAHLSSATQFWALSINAGLAGEPTRYLQSFDPVATPAQMVESVRHMTAGEVLAQFVESNDALAAAVADLSRDQWAMPAESPAGHVAIEAAALHALWDSWIHERDVLLPLGVTPPEEADEVAASLTYVAALGPALLASEGSTRQGALRVEATDPDVRLVVRAGESVIVEASPADGATTGPCLSGRAVDLVEGLSLRAPLEHDLAPDDQWLLGGLAQAFDVSV